MTKKQEVAEAGVPAYLKDVQAQTGQDNFTSEDVIIPQAKLLQGMSDQVTAFNEAVPGIFWHTSMDVSLGDSFDFVPCSRRRKYLLMAPIHDGRGVLARADDAMTWDRTGEWTVALDKSTSVEWRIVDRNVARSGLTAWGTSDPADAGSPPAATLFYEYLVILPDHLDYGPCVITLARSSIKKARKGLNDKISLHQSLGRPLQALKFNARSVTERSAVGQTFFNWHFSSAGFAAEAEYGMAKALDETISDYSVHDEGAPEEAAPVDASDEAPF